MVIFYRKEGKKCQSVKWLPLLIKNGGVGKTTTTVNLGNGLFRKGKRVLLIDLDPQGDLTTSLGYKNPNSLDFTIKNLMEKEIQEIPISKKDGILKNGEGVSFIPANIELEALELSMIKYMNKENILKKYINKIREDYDYILIDCRPALGLLTINALATADSVIIPVQAQYLPLKDMTQLMQTIDKIRGQINPKLKIEGILLTMVDMKTNLAKASIESLKNNYGRRIKIYDTIIPMGIKAAESTIEGKSVYAYDKKSKPAIAYEELTKEVLKDSERNKTRLAECRWII